MAKGACPSCGKAVPPRVKTACPYCKKPLRSAEDAAEAVAGQLEREAREIAEWRGDSRESPPALATRTIVFISLLLVTAPITIIFREHGIAFLTGALAGLSAVVGLNWLAIDLRVAKARHAATPEEACMYFFCRVALKRYAFAETALSGHASAVKRHARLRMSWGARESAGPFLGDFKPSEILVGDAQMVAEDVARVPVSFGEQATGGITVPGVGSVTGTETRARLLVKLLVKRNGRWFLVNGLPSDRIDEQLVGVLAKQRSTES